ncbi:hypothetical protein, partial [Acetobacter senegalensis]|uniref:hypothetical protein n=2 Tax=Acetobacter TaxID=434 RepID=UPI00112340BA
MTDFSSIFRDLNLDQGTLDSINDIISYSPTLTKQLMDFTQGGGRITYSNSNITGYSGKENNVINFTSQIINKGNNASILNPYVDSNTDQHTLSEAEIIIGNLAHELGHFEDSSNPSNILNSLNKNNPEQGKVFEAAAIESEAKAVYNNTKIQFEIYNKTNGKYLIQDSIVNSTGSGADQILTRITEQNIRDSINGGQDENEILPSLAQLMANQKANGNGEIYSIYYQNAWKNAGGAAPAPLPSGSNLSESDPTYTFDDQGNLTGYTAIVTNYKTDNTQTVTVTLSSGNSGNTTEEWSITDPTSGETIHYGSFYQTGGSLDTSSFNLSNIYGSSTTIEGKPGQNISISAESDTYAGIDSQISIQNVKKFTVSGNQNIVTTAASDTTVIVAAQQETINATAGDLVALAQNAEATVNGDKVTTLLNQDGAHATVIGNDTTVEDWTGSATLDASGATVMMDGNTYTPGTRQSLTLNGDNDVVSVSDNGAVFVSGKSETINGASGGWVALSANADATINNSGQTVFLNQQGAHARLTASDNSVQVWANNTSLDGNGQNIILAGDTDTHNSQQIFSATGQNLKITVADGINASITASNAQIAIGKNANVQINGTGDQIISDANSQVSTSQSGNSVSANSTPDNQVFTPSEPVTLITDDSDTLGTEPNSGWVIEYQGPSSSGRGITEVMSQPGVPAGSDSDAGDNAGDSGSGEDDPSMGSGGDDEGDDEGGGGGGGKFDDGGEEEEKMLISIPTKNEPSNSALALSPSSSNEDILKSMSFLSEASSSFKEGQGLLRHDPSMASSSDFLKSYVAHDFYFSGTPSTAGTAWPVENTTSSMVTAQRLCRILCGGTFSGHWETIIEH